MDTFVLGDFGAAPRAGAYSRSIKSDRVVVNTDPRALTQGPAEAAADHLREQLRLAPAAAPATLAARRAAVQALAQGKAWAVERYGAGRPGQSDRLFQDSGRLLASLAINETRDGWSITIAADRLDPAGLGGVAELARVFERLRQVVPAWADPKLLVQASGVQRALGQSVAAAVQKATADTAALRAQLMRR
jgi:hypothetical protein